MGYKFTRLTFEQRTVLRAWIGANRAKLEELPRFAQFELCAAEMGFPVSLSQYGSDARKMGLAKVIKHPNRKRKNGSSSSTRRSADVEFHDLRMICFCLATYIVKLFDDLGVEYGDDLKMMADFHRMTKANDA